MLLGAIADDVTGGTDLASLLRREGLGVVQTFDVPDELPRADAVVVSLKTRTAPPDVACDRSRMAARALTTAGAERLFFKYCSTFDSTDRGNIGPVIDTLLEATGTDFTVACPAYPALGRTVYAGHLFVGRQLLSESPMRHHPLTPMTDANLVRVLARQTSSLVGLVELHAVEGGPASIREHFGVIRGVGQRVAIVDALFDRHVRDIAAASVDLRLATGGAALGGGLARVLRPQAAGAGEALAVRPSAPVAILSGSCSAATRAQIQHVSGCLPMRLVDPIALADDPGELGRVIDWASEQVVRGRLMVYSSAEPGAVAAAQARLGREAAASLVEGMFAAVARALAERGVRTFVVAGGETSAAVVAALDVRMIAFGDDLAPGVPWTRSLGSDFILALKSGNFGPREFFAQALGQAR